MLKGNSESWLIVGLGNPGKEYEHTRHNTGFRAIDILAAKLGCRIMNLSGRSVLQLSAYFSIPPQRIIVMFDDISLAPGRLRVRAEGSAGGHNGIKSIIAELGSQDFPRVKIGVGAKPTPEYDLANWVLSSFSAKEEKDLSIALENAADAALAIMEQGVPEAANRYNGSHP